MWGVLFDGVGLVAIIAGLFFVRMGRKAVCGSKERFNLNTAAIVAEIVVALYFSFEAITALQEEDYVDAGICTGVVIVTLFYIAQLLKDDNWFNNQFKKLKNGLKNLGKQLSNMRLPSLSPSPA